MKTTHFAGRKSRLVRNRANGRPPDWRGVGSVTIFAPGETVEWKNVAYTVVFQDKQGYGELRSATVHLQPIRKPIGWYIWLVMGIALARLYYTL